MTEEDSKETPKFTETSFIRRCQKVRLFKVLIVRHVIHGIWLSFISLVMHSNAKKVFNPFGCVHFCIIVFRLCDRARRMVPRVSNLYLDSD